MIFYILNNDTMKEIYFYFLFAAGTEFLYLCCARLKVSERL